MPARNITSEPPAAPSRGRTILSVFAAALATCGVIAACVGGLDAALGQTLGGRSYLVRGLMVGVVGTAIALLTRPKGAGELRRLGIVAFGVWPFAAFVLFISWRIGVSVEQGEHCEAGNAQECFTLAARRDRRGRLDEAAVLFARGCELGNAASCATLGFRGESLGLTPDATNGRLAQACEGEVALACARLAERIQEVDPTRAVALRSAACVHGDASSCSTHRP